MTARVLNVERASGCRPELLELLEAWKVRGTFDITIPEDGGYRFGPAAERVQAHFFDAKLSHARTLEGTPHGRRCAIDCHPVGFKPNRSFEEQPGMREKFQAWGAHVELCGLVWGGRFRNFGSDGDMPHAELPHWRTRYQFPSGEPVSPETKMSEQKPSVGRVVHYQAHGSPDGTHKPAARAAMITEVISDGIVSLCVLNPSGFFFNQGCLFDGSDAPKGGTWRWPPRV